MKKLGLSIAKLSGIIGLREITLQSYLSGSAAIPKIVEHFMYLLLAVQVAKGHIDIAGQTIKEFREGSKNGKRKDYYA